MELQVKIGCVTEGNLIASQRGDPGWIGQLKKLIGALTSGLGPCFPDKHQNSDDQKTETSHSAQYISIKNGKGMEILFAYQRKYCWIY